MLESQTAANATGSSIAGFLRITIGPKQYRLRKDLLTSSSLFFRACSNGNFKEGIDNHIALPEDEQTGFEEIIQWLYVGSFNIVNVDDIVTLIEAYIIADKYLMYKCANQLIDEVRNFHRINIMSKKVFEELERLHVDPDNRMYQYCLDQHAWDICHWPESYTLKVIDGLPDSHPPDMFPGLRPNVTAKLSASMRGLRWLRGTGRTIEPDPAVIDGCDYHLHDDHSDYCSFKLAETQSA